MKKLRLLLLDACVVIRLHEWGIWERIVERCEIVLPESVVSESLYFEADQRKVSIDLEPAVKAGLVEVVRPSASAVQAFLDRFTPAYRGVLDAGEAECLAVLAGSAEPCLVCSADAIVPRVLGCLRREDQGLSLEELSERCGLGRKVPAEYGKKRFAESVKRGQSDGFLGTALNE